MGLPKRSMYDGTRCLNSFNVACMGSMMPTTPIEPTMAFDCSQAFLWPIGLIFLSIPFAILTGFNPARFTLSIYFG